MMQQQGHFYAKNLAKVFIVKLEQNVIPTSSRKNYVADSIRFVKLNYIRKLLDTFQKKQNKKTKNKKQQQKKELPLKLQKKINFVLRSSANT